MSDFSLKHKVCVHYTGSFDDGEVFDTTRGRTPLTYIEGNHEVVPGFEMAVLSMKPGETKSVTWKFTKPGDFLFACNFVGHSEAGMLGNITVK